MMLFATENGWWSYADLKRKCEWLDDNDHVGDYQADSPYADFITGYNTDSYADGLCELLVSLYESYVDECEDEEREVVWDEFLDFCWKDFDYQLLHTWLRVTNIHNESDEEIRLFARECDTCTMRERLETV